MNQQDKLKQAKNLTKERLKDFLADLDQIGPYEWASLEQVGPQDEVWVTIKLTARKKFNIDEAVEDFADWCSQEERKKERKNANP